MLIEGGDTYENDELLKREGIEGWVSLQKREKIPQRFSRGWKSEGAFYETLRSCNRA